MENILNHPMMRLMFDLTVNDGWNATAMMIYIIIIGLCGLAIYENRKG